MPNNTDKVKTEIAKVIHKIQMESAKLNDAHTEGISILYLEWDELHQETKDWYLTKADGLMAIPNLLIKADNQHAEYAHDNSATWHGTDDMIKKMAYTQAYNHGINSLIKEGWIKPELKENK